MSYELERAKQESIMREAKANGAHYCNNCKLTKYGPDGRICTKEHSPYRKRIEIGEKLYVHGISILEIDNIITLEYPCEFWKKGANEV